MEAKALSRSEACLQEDFPNRTVDAVVIGSGYGGSVAAFRLAAQERDADGKPCRVAVLERGEEWLSGEFPDGLGKAFGQVRMPGNSGIQGNPQGLFELRVGDGLAALVGNALGGTSLINANLLRKPDEEVFQRRRAGLDGSGAFLWPAPLQEPEALDPYYGLARKMLGAQPLGAAFHGSRQEDKEWRINGWGEPLKRQALRGLQKMLVDAGVAARMDETEWLTVRNGEPGAMLDEKGNLPGGQCVACGECVAGCNFSAKLTLTHSYLARAKAAGAHLYTGAAVQWLEKLPGGDWQVAYLASCAEQGHESGMRIPIQYVRAKRVVLAAGTFGSTEILLRSQARAESRLRFSEQLGQRLSTNGDNLAAIYLQQREVNGVGVGAAGMARDGQAVGPTITGCIQIGNANVEQRLLIQDAAVPRALAGIYHELLTSFGAWAQLAKLQPFQPNTLARGRRPLHDWASLHSRSLAHTQLLLLMGHDRSGGSMKFDQATGLEIKYDRRELAEVGSHQMDILRQGVARGDGQLLDNPLLWASGPEGGALSGMTVHPLGGCCMGDSVETGVVDHAGRVFDPDAADPSGVHEGLYVLDGSIVPGSLGANPLWTITALAERACGQWGLRPVRPQVALENPLLPPARDKKTRAAALRQVPVRFTEVLRSSAFLYRPHPDAEAGWDWHQARLLLHMPLPSLEAFAADPEHAVVLATPKLLPGREAGSFRIDDSSGRCLANLTVVGGTLHLLPMKRYSAWQRCGGAARVVMTSLLRAKPGKFDSLRALAGKLVVAWHMAEEREMTYRIQLREPAGQGRDAREYMLVGTKRVGYAAGWWQLLTALPALLLNKPLERRNVWDAFTTLDAQLYRSGGELVGQGELQMDLVDLTRYYAPQLGMRGNTPDALVTLAGYAAWMLRLLLITRFPDVAPRQLPPDERVTRKWRDEPTSDPRPMWGDGLTQLTSGTLLPYPALQVRGVDGCVQRIPAEGPHRFKVKRRRGTDEEIELFLVHYSNNLSAEENRRCGDGVLQTNAILMLNGFAQSTLSNVPQEFDRSKDEIGLAAFFHEQGMDVWMLEYRLSPVLEASRLPSNMDQIAEFDIPVAVDRVLREIRCRLKPEQKDAKLQLHAFAHCIGSGALAMSILSGRLNHHVVIDASGKPRRASKLASVTFSQIHPYLVGSESAQMRLQLAALLQNAGGIDYLNLSPADKHSAVAREPSEALERALDGLFASLPSPPEELCPEERWRRPWSAPACTCKRMGGVISRVLKHSQLKPETHAMLPEYFGRANTGILGHGGLCVERERLVNADGQNVYVTAEQLAQHLNMPVALLHGKHNQLFNFESARVTHRQLQAFVPHMPENGHRLILAESFAHFDCTISAAPAMRAEILGPLGEFLRDARQINREPVSFSEPPLCYVVQPPLAGPVLGWSRAGKKEGERLLRLWIAVDEERTTLATFAMIVIGEGSRARVIPCEVERMLVERKAEWVTSPAAPGTIAVAVADISVSKEDFEPGKPLRVAMVSVHEIPEAALLSGKKDADDPRQPVPLKDLPDPATIRVGANRFYPGPTRPWTAPWRLPANLHAILHARLRDPVKVEGLPQAPAEPFPPVPLSHPDISSHDAEQGLAGLRRQQAAVRNAALQAWPSTIARRLRDAYPLGGEEAGTVLISETLFQRAGTSSLCFVAACCQHPGTPAEADRADASMLAIAEGLDNGTIPAQFICLVGDQIYADATAGLTDSLSPIERIRSATLRAFNAAGFRKVTSRLPTYMTLDDHEIENEWSLDRLEFRPGHEGKQVEAERLRGAAMAYVKAYQWMHSPCNGRAPDCFDYSFDAVGSRFYTLDTRSRRKRFGQPQVCEPTQLAALEDWLASGKDADALHVITMGSVLAPGLHAFDTGGRIPHPAADNWQLAPEQRQQVLKTMATCRARHVVLLSGDYHCSAVSVLRFYGDKGELFKTAHAIVVPPLYAPFPAINAHPNDLMEKETIQLDGGCTVEIETEAWYGQGYSVMRLEHLGSGHRVLEVNMHLTLLDAGDAPRAKAVCKRLPLA